MMHFLLVRLKSDTFTFEQCFFTMRRTQSVKQNKFKFYRQIENPFIYLILHYTFQYKFVRLLIKMHPFGGLFKYILGKIIALVVDNLVNTKYFLSSQISSSFCLFTTINDHLWYKINSTSDFCSFLWFKAHGDTI